jgi:RNA polymerase sigma-70 factor (ECF subfamily)
MNLEQGNRSAPEGPAQFRTTHWSVVLQAGKAEESASADALEHLCRGYWHPIYAFVRRRGCSPEEAQDLVQGFFAALLRRKGLERVDPAKGRFRSFLLASVTHYLANERQRERGQKRGGGCEMISLDASDKEERYLVEPAHDLTPERLFEQRWAHLVLERVVARLQAELAAAGHAERFDRLKPFLSDDPEGVSYAEAAASLSLSVGAVTSMIHRMRLRYRELFRDEIAQTVADPSEVDDEIRHLIAAFAP